MNVISRCCKVSTFVGHVSEISIYNVLEKKNQIFGVPNRILRDTCTGVSKTDKTWRVSVKSLPIGYLLKDCISSKS